MIRTIKNLLKNPKYLLVISLITTSLVGCNGCKLEGNSGKTKQGIVLLSIPNCYEPAETLKQKLEKDFPKVTILNLTKKEAASTEYNLQEQVQEAFKTLKEQNMTDYELVLFGDTNSGLAAWELYQQHKNELNNVKLILTHHTPWEGIPILDNTDADWDKFIDSLTAGVPQHNDLDKDKAHIKEECKGLCHHFTTILDIESLKTNSPFLQKVKTNLSQTQVPIVAIAGHKIDAYTLAAGMLIATPKTKNAINQEDFNKLWAQLVGAASDEHDFLVPLSSQTAKNINKNNNFVEIILEKQPFFCPEHLTNPATYEVIAKNIRKYLKGTQ